MIINYLIKLFVGLDNLCYKIISRLAIAENGGVHPKHRIMNYHEFFVNNITAGDVVLDIGCGKGENASDVAGKAKKVVAIDIKPSNIDYAKKTYNKTNLEFITGDVLNYNFDCKFDKIILSNVLEHIEKRADFLVSLHKMSGVILLRVPMLDRDWLVVYKQQKGLEYRLDPTHFVEYTLDTLNEELAKSNWLIKSYSIQFGEFWGVLTSS